MTYSSEQCIDQPDDYYSLRLYIAGKTTHSVSAIQNLMRICQEYLPEHYHVEVIDVCQQPEQAETENIVVIPTLIKVLPLPIQRMVGNLSNTEKVLTGLGISPHYTAPVEALPNH
ncbi:MAG TPA: circadian clock KaiB family protein [Allocoleopsis sp.]